MHIALDSLQWYNGILEETRKILFIFPLHSMPFLFASSFLLSFFCLIRLCVYALELLLRFAACAYCIVTFARKQVT